MADGQELDNLLIRVDSELGSLSGIQSAIDALQRLSQFNRDATNGIKQLGSLGTAFKKFDGINLKGLDEASRGVKNLVGALDDLSKVGAVTKKQFNDFGRLGKVLKDSFDGVGTALKDIEQVSTGVNNMVHALASLGQVQGVTKQSISQLGLLGDAIHHFNGLDKDIEKVIDPMERLMKAIGNLGNNNKVSIRVDSNGVASVRNITRHTQKAMSTWQQFEQRLENDVNGIDLGQLFDISQPVDKMQSNLKIAERQLQSYENQVRTNAQKISNYMASFSLTDLVNDKGFRNAYYSGSMAEAYIEQYRQSIPQLRSAIEGANTQAIEEAWKHTQEAIRRDSQIDLSELINTNLPIENIRANFRTLQNELSRAESSMQRAFTELRRLRSLESDEQRLRSQGSYRTASYTYAVSARHVEQYRTALQNLQTTMRTVEREQQSDVPLLRQLPQLEEQLRRYQEMYDRLLNTQSRTPEQDRQLGVFQDGIDAIRDRIQQIHDTLEDIPETTEGVIERMRQVADEADRMARATAEAQRNLQESVGGGFSQFGNLLSGSGNQLLGSVGKLSSQFGGMVQKGLIPEGTVAGLEGVAGALSRVATIASAVTAVVGVLVALFKTWWSTMNKVKDAMTQFVQSAIQFAKNMLTHVVGAFNAVSGAVGKVVSAVRSGAQAITVALRQIRDIGAKIISVFSSFGGNAVSSVVKAGKAIANLVTPKVVKNLASVSGSLKDIVKQSKLLSTALQTAHKWFTMITRMLMRKIVQQFLSGLKQAFDDLVLFEKNSDDAMLKFNYHVSEIFSALRRAANQWIAAFEPLINAVTPVILNFLANVQSIGEAVAIFMAKLTGQGYYIRAKKFYEDYGESLDKTTKKAKNLTNALDELNILNDSSSKNDSDLPVEDLFEPVSGGLNFPDIQIAIQDILDKIKEWLKSIDWDWLKEKAREWVRKIFEAINTILRDKEFWQLLGKTVAELVNFLFTIVNEAVHDLDWKALGQAIAEFIKSALENLDWELIRDTVVTLAQGLATMWNEIFADKQLWKDIGETVAHVINDVIVAYLDSFAWTFNFANMADSISLAIKTALEGINWEQIRHAVDGWTKGITDIINTWASDKQLWTDIGNTIKHTINDIFINAFNDLGDINFAELTDSIKTAIINALDINWDEFNEGVQKWAQNIADVINGFLADEEFLTTITTSIANFANAIIDGFDSLLKKLQSYDIGTAIGNAIVTGLSNIHWDTLFTLPANAINALSNAIRGLLDAIPDDFNLGTWLADHLSLTIETVDWDLIEKNINDFADQVVKTINGLIESDRLWNGLEKITTVSLDIVVNLIGKIREINWSDLAQRIVDYVNTVIKGGYVRQILSDLGDIAIDLLFTVDLFITGVDWSELGRQIAEGLSHAIDRLYENRGALQQMIENAFKAFSDLVSETLKGLLKSDAFYKLGSIIGRLILGIINGLAIFFEDNTTNIIKAMKQFAEGLAEELNKHHDEIVNSLNTIIDSICAIITEFFDDKGALMKEVNSILEDLHLDVLMQTIIDVIVRKIFAKLRTLSAISESIGGLGAIISNFASSFMENLLTYLWEGLKKGWDKFWSGKFDLGGFELTGGGIIGFIQKLLGIENGINIGGLFDNLTLTGKDKAEGTFVDKIKNWWDNINPFKKKDGSSKVEVPIEPVVDDSTANKWDDLFDDSKKVPIELEDPKLGTITASLIEVDEIKAKKLNLEEINAEVLNVIEIFADKLHVGEIDSNTETKKKDLDPNYGANDVGVQTGSVNNPNGDLHVKNIYAELLDVKKILSELLEVTEIKTELLDAEKIITRLIDAKKITTKWLDAKKITTKLLDAQKITTKLLEASQILTDLMEAQKVHTWLFEVEKIDVKEGADGIGVSLQDVGGTLNLEGINAGWLNVPTITADLLRVGTIEGNIRGTSGYTPTGIIGVSTGTSNYDNMFGVPSIERPRIEVGDRWSDISGLAPHAEDFLTGVENYWANLTDTWGKTVSVTPAVNLAGNDGGYGVTHTLPRYESGSNGSVIPLSDFDKNMSGVVAGAKINNLPSNADYIRDYLMSFIGNENGVYGLMGNLYAESGLLSNNLQDTKKGEGVTQRDLDYTKKANSSSSSFINDSKGYGLAQWTTSDRKKAFYDSLNGRSVDDLGAQLEFLKQELMSSEYKGVLDKLRNASTIEDASNAVLYGYEKPADQSASQAELRMAYGQDIAGQLGSYDGTVNIEDEETPKSDGIKGFDEANVIGETGGTGGIFSFLDTLPLQTEYRMAEVYNIIDKWLGRIYKLFKSFTVDGFLEDLLKLNEIGDIFDSTILKELRDVLEEIADLLRKLIEDGIKSVEDTRHLDLNTDAKSQNTRAVEDLTDAIYDWIKCAGDTGHLDNNTVAKSKNTLAVEQLNRTIGSLGTQLINVKCECNCCGNCSGCGGGSSTTTRPNIPSYTPNTQHGTTDTISNPSGGGSTRPTTPTGTTGGGSITPARPTGTTGGGSVTPARPTGITSGGRTGKIVIKQNGKSVPMFINMGGTLVPLTDSSPDYVKQSALSGKYAFLDSTGKSVSSNDQKTLLAYIRNKWGNTKSNTTSGTKPQHYSLKYGDGTEKDVYAIVDGKMELVGDKMSDDVKRNIDKYPLVFADGTPLSEDERRTNLNHAKSEWTKKGYLGGGTDKNNTSKTGLESTTHTVDNAVNLDRNTQTADTGTIKNPSVTKTSGGDNLPATTKTNDTGGKPSNKSSGGSNTGGGSHSDGGSSGSHDETNNGGSGGGNTSGGSDSSNKDDSGIRKSSWGAIMHDGQYEQDGRIYNANGTVFAISHEKMAELEKEHAEEIAKKNQERAEEAKKRAEEANAKKKPFRDDENNQDGVNLANENVDKIRNKAKEFLDNINSNGSDAQKATAKTLYEHLMGNYTYGAGDWKDGSSPSTIMVDDIPIPVNGGYYQQEYYKLKNLSDQINALKPTDKDKSLSELSSALGQIDVGDRTWKFSTGGTWYTSTKNSPDPQHKRQGRMDKLGSKFTNFEFEFTADDAQKAGFNSVKEMFDALSKAGANIYSKSGTTLYETYKSNVLQLKSTQMAGLFDKLKSRYMAKGYQMGGIPNAGEIFVARENGTPEFVGSFGNKTVVANNDQIVTAVANGVAMANDSLRSAIENQTNALENAIDRKNLDVNIGDRQIAEANRRGEKDLGQNFIG